jgi:hypothetical protein
MRDRQDALGDFDFEEVSHELKISMRRSEGESDHNVWKANKKFFGPVTGSKVRNTDSSCQRCIQRKKRFRRGRRGA